MKRATPIPFILLASLALAALFAPVSKTTVPTGGPINSGDVAWMLTASALVLLMTPGLSFFYGGMVGLKNVVSTMLQSVVALGVISLVWLLVVSAWPLGTVWAGMGSSAIPLTFLMFDGVGEATHPTLSPTIPLLIFALFQLKFAIITPALITGSFAERVRFSSYLLFIVLFSLFIYAPLAHWTWHPDGFLRKWGVLDFAGGTVVHMSAGWAALAGALILGRRKSHVSNEIALAGQCPVRAAGHGDALVWLVRLQRRLGRGRQRLGRDGLRNHEHGLGSGDARLDVLRLDAGAQALGARRLHRRRRRPGGDHARGGVRHASREHLHRRVRQRRQQHGRPLEDRSRPSTTRSMSSPVMASAGWSACSARGSSPRTSGFHGIHQRPVTDPTTFLAHLAALVVVSVFSFVGSWILFKVTDLIIPLRVSAEEEIEGLDLSQHGETAIAAELLLAPSTNGNGVHAPLSKELVLS